MQLIMILNLPSMLIRQTFNMSQYINITANKPRLVSTMCLAAVLFLSVISTHVVKAQTLTGEQKQQKQQKHTKSKNNLLPSHLSEKFYRQALYFYFQNKPEEALNQLNTNKEYFANTPAHESLFRVGLQISQGLHQNAQTLLKELLVTNDHSLEDSYTSDTHTATDTFTDSAKHHLKTEVLQTIVLLQLAEQQIAQQNLPNAQRILAKINKLPQGYLAQYYLAQYYIMQQLIVWPEQPNIESLPLNNNSKTQLQNLINSTTNITTLPHNSFDNKVPYIVLNQALSAMEQKQYGVAEEKLTRIQQFTWLIAQESFWQQLFSSKTANEAVNKENKKASYKATASEKANTKKIEQNGIQQYAQLLLAQLYIEQGLFQQGYDQLERFPKNTPFTEQALFLFGYTAFKLQKFNASEVILNTLIKQYPYANFTQQAWALSAEQYTAQQQLNKALNRYLHIETYYQNKQQTLATFAATVAQQTDLLSFYHLPNKHQQNNNATDHTLWVNASLSFGNTPVLYQQLQSIENLVKQLTAQQRKSYWLANTIALNTTRQNNIRTQQENTQYNALLTQLAVKKNELSSLLTQAKQRGNGELFASETEKLQLTRIANSHNALALITRVQNAILENEPAVHKTAQSTGVNAAHAAQKQKVKKYNTAEYQQRLARVQGVLAWQLKQQFSERYWQAQQALNTVDTLYNTTLQQYNKVEALLNVSNTQEKGSLSQITAKHTQLNQHIATLLEKTARIKAKINQQLLTQSTQFIEQEQEKINQFLLFNQRAMANVIEQLNAMTMPNQAPNQKLNQEPSEELNQYPNQKTSQSFSQKGAFNDTL